MSLLAGMSSAARFDATASPRTFAGLGSDGLLTWRQTPRSNGMEFTVALGGSAQRFRAEGGRSSGSATEQLVTGELRGAALRSLIRSGDASMLSLGASLDGMFARTRHSYDDPSDRTADFIFASATLGPALASERSVGRGTARIDLASPLIGVVDHPFSDTRSGEPALRVRVAGVAMLHGINGGFTYAPAPGRHIGLVYMYRFSLLAYEDVQPMRSASQSLSMGIVTGGWRR